MALLVGLFCSYGTAADQAPPAPVPSPPAPQASLPTFFNPKDNGVEISDLALDYELTKDDLLKIGGISLDSIAVSFDVQPVTPTPDTKYSYQFSWPTKFLSEGQIELISAKDDTVFYNRKVTKSEIKNVAGDQSHLEPVVDASEVKKLTDQTFRFCLTQPGLNFERKICSHSYILRPDDKGFFRLRDLNAVSHDKDEDSKTSKSSNFQDVLAVAKASAPGDLIKIALPISDEAMKSLLAPKEAPKHSSFKMVLKDSQKEFFTGESHYRREEFVKALKGTAHALVQFCVGAVCSDDYKLEAADILVPHSVTQQVLVDEKVVSSKGTVALSDSHPETVIKFFFANGAESSLKIALPADRTDYFDFVRAEKADTFLVAAHGPRPTGIQVSEFTDGWRAEITKANPTLTFAGPSDIVLTQRFKWAKAVPTEALRPMIKGKRSNRTYSEEPLLKGYIVEKEKVENLPKVSSTEKEIQDAKGYEFNWLYSTKDKMMFNASHAKVASGTDEFTANFPVYRSAPYEIEGKLSGMFSSSSILYLGEVAGGAWFERILKSDSPSLSVQRWGADASYSFSLNSPQVSTQQTLNLSRLGANIKYRLTPGVVYQDASFGVELAYQNITYSSLTDSMLGLGLFWQRPIFQFIDSAANHLKWLRHPKWFEATAQYYPLSMTAGTQVGANYNANARFKFS